MNGLTPPDGPQTSAAALRIDVFSIFPEAVDAVLDDECRRACPA